MSTNNKPSPMKFPWALAAIGGLFAAKKISGAVKKGSDKRKDEIRKANEMLKEQRRAYMDIDITNPYMGLTNAYADMENVAEDLTVDQEAVQFQAEQGAQQRADIMQQLRGLAGTSGIAGLAQSLAQQQTMQARQISTDISRQENINRQMLAQQAGRIQELQRGAQMQVQQTQAYGDQIRQQREMARQEVLLAGAYQRSGAALEAQTRYREGLIGGATNIVGGLAGGLSGSTFNF